MPTEREEQIKAILLQLALGAIAVLFLVLDIKDIFQGEVDLGKHFPFLVEVECLFFIWCVRKMMTIPADPEVKPHS